MGYRFIAIVEFKLKVYVIIKRNSPDNRSYEWDRL